MLTWLSQRSSATGSTSADTIRDRNNGVVAHEPKGLEEGAAGSNDTQVLIKNNKWVADGINDSLRKRKSVSDIDESCGFRRKRSEHANLLPYS
jgi:hypothetical protein